MNDQSPSDPEEKRVCARCVDEKYLSAEIAGTGSSEPCSYCGESVSPTWSINELAERVSYAIDEHYERTPTRPSLHEQAIYFTVMHEHWERDGATINETIEELAEVSAAIAEDIRVLLDEWGPVPEDSPEFEDERPFCAEAHYEQKGIDTREWEEQWRDFERSLKEESRYFNHRAVEILNEVFSSIHNLPAQDGQEIIENAGPGTGFTRIFRARAFQSKEELREAIERPDIHLGPPPLRLAAAGRMNARGISVFYGASTSKIALAEVRPPVGSNVAVACFKFMRGLKLLNLINLEKLDHLEGSLFDSTYGMELEKVSFLRTLGNRLARPIMPSDQDIDYIATQAVADYLANNTNPSIDGIIFKSVQSSDQGYNIVLFHQSSCVKEMDVPKGTGFRSDLVGDTEDEIDTQYTVIEEVPEEDKESKAEAGPKLPWPYDFKHYDWDDESDARIPSLEIDTSQISVHLIRAAEFTSHERPVLRYRVPLKLPKRDS